MLIICLMQLRWKWCLSAYSGKGATTAMTSLSRPGVFTGFAGTAGSFHQSTLGPYLIFTFIPAFPLMSVSTLPVCVLHSGCESFRFYMPLSPWQDTERVQEEREVPAKPPSSFLCAHLTMTVENCFWPCPFFWTTWVALGWAHLCLPHKCSPPSYAPCCVIDGFMRTHFRSYIFCVLPALSHIYPGMFLCLVMCYVSYAIRVRDMQVMHGVYG